MSNIEIGDRVVITADYSTLFNRTGIVKCKSDYGYNISEIYITDIDTNWKNENELYFLSSEVQKVEDIIL